MTAYRKTSPEMTALVATIVCAIVCAAAVGVWRGLFLAVNVVAFGHYGFDKYRASNGARRVPEIVLLGLAAVGGVPGSLLGQIVFHHKTSKSRFKRVFWTIAAVQVVVLLVIAHLRGR